MGSQKAIRISALIIALIDVAAIIYAFVVGKNPGFIVIISIVGIAGCILLLISDFLFSLESRAHNRDEDNPSIFRVAFGLIAMYFLAIAPLILFFISYK